MSKVNRKKAVSKDAYWPGVGRLQHWQFFCCHILIETSNIFHILSFCQQPPIDTLSFFTCHMYISQTCPQWIVSAQIALAHSPFLPCEWRLLLWAVIGQWDKAGEWSPGSDCIISDRGHRVRGERGLPDTTKKQNSATGFLQSSPLSVKCSALFMFAAKQSKQSRAILYIFCPMWY